MKCSSVAAIVLAGTMAPFLPANAGNDPIVIETVRLKYARPSEVAQTLSDCLTSSGTQTKSLLPEGIAEVIPNDGDATLILSGTTSAVTEMKTVLRLLDIRPRQVHVKARLIEVRYAADGTPRETLLQAPALSTTNNRPARISIGYPRVQGMTLEVTPHVNGDQSISVQAQLTGRRLSTRPADETPAGNRIQSASVTALLRVPQGGEMQKSRPLFLNFYIKPTSDESKTVPKMVEVDGQSYPVDYPMYRVEVSANEIKGSSGSGTR